MLQIGRFIPLTDGSPTNFDHGAYDAGSDRVFVAHTAAGCVEVIDARTGMHLRALPGFPEAAGIVAAGTVVVTNRSAASVSLVDATTLQTTATFPTGVRPNGVAYVPSRSLVVVACVGNDDAPPLLQCIHIGTGETQTLLLPGRPRWCVTDAAGERVYCAIREPSGVFVAGLPTFREETFWPLPSEGAHGVDLDDVGRHLYVACDGGVLVALDAATGTVVGQWPLPGVPDATFFNPDSGLVHVAIGDPGVVVSVDPATGQTATCATEGGAKTTALVRSDRLHVFLPQRGGVLELTEQLPTA